MAKGYWVAGLKITNQAKYDAYRAVNGEAFRKFGGRFLVRGGEFENHAAKPWPRNIVIEFPSYEAAKACYVSPEYKKALDARGDGVEINVVIVEGYDGPQP